MEIIFLADKKGNGFLFTRFHSGLSGERVKEKTHGNVIGQTIF